METWKKLLKQKWVAEGRVHCHWCEKRLNLLPGKNGNYMTVDHLLEKALGGTDAESNLAPACGKCNNSRSTGVQTLPYAGQQTLVDSMYLKRRGVLGG